jgi:hypothetical protein
MKGDERASEGDYFSFSLCIIQDLD